LQKFDHKLIDQFGAVNCLRITEDKSSDKRVHASDARLIKATRTKVRCGVRCPRLNTTTMPRRRAQSPCHSTTSVLRHKAWNPH